MTQSLRGDDMKSLGRCNRSTYSGRKRSSIGSMSNSDPGSTEETSFPEEGAAKNPDRKHFTNPRMQFLSFAGEKDSSFVAPNIEKKRG
ncbi:hypothetical protein NC651_003793 [Populus alba x Populus x berolinensis]|nr:hypothetical protein NC651_003793 [Populus alba x Populus x berolinensis]